jgi:hypothetical protein
MKLEEVTGLFALAGIPVLRVKSMTDGYSCGPDDPRFFEKPPRCVWWFVKTPAGWVEIGWRKRVIAINWEDTHVRKIITKDDVTKSETDVHAWSNLKALEYLTALAPELPKVVARPQDMEAVRKLAEQLAEDIFAEGKGPGGSCNRIQFLGGEYPHNEIDHGGFCKLALAGALQTSLHKHLNGAFILEKPQT